mmetsp:Transcript_7392/g.12780  ORF Transcript_7392/g.12780 Transcript_7392/m.12780 type:complete len:641 (+) Transcript_7392:510-2432(+)
MEQGDSSKAAGANEVIIPSTSSRVQSLARELTRPGELDTQSLEAALSRTPCLTCGASFQLKKLPNDFLKFPLPGVKEDVAGSGLCAPCTTTVCKVEKVDFQHYKSKQVQPTIKNKGATSDSDLYDLKTMEERNVRDRWLRVRPKIIAYALPLVQQKLQELERILEAEFTDPLTGIPLPFIPAATGSPRMAAGINKGYSPQLPWVNSRQLSQTDALGQSHPRFSSADQHAKSAYARQREGLGLHPAGTHAAELAGSKVRLSSAQESISGPTNAYLQQLENSSGRLAGSPRGLGQSVGPPGASLGLAAKTDGRARVTQANSVGHLPSVIKENLLRSTEVSQPQAISPSSEVALGHNEDVAAASATKALMEYLKNLSPEDMVKLKTTMRETLGADNLPAQKAKIMQSESNSEDGRSSEVPDTNAFGGSDQQLGASHSQDPVDGRSTRDNDESALGTQDPKGHKIADWERQLLNLNEGKRQRVEREKREREECKRSGKLVRIEDWERQLLEQNEGRKERKARTDRERSSQEEFSKKLDLEQTQKGKIDEWERELLERNEGRRAQENRRKYLRQPHPCPSPPPTSSHGVGASSPSSSGYPNVLPQISRHLPSYLSPSEVAHAKQQQAHGGFSRAPGGAAVGGGAD